MGRGQGGRGQGAGGGEQTAHTWAVVGGRV